jgi:L-lactate dehydrogenase complex protein LldG
VEREQFLSRVRAALRGAELPDAPEPGAAPEISFANPVAVFVAEAGAVDADVVRLTSGTVVAAVQELFGRLATSRFIAWDGLDDIAPGWNEWIAAARLERVDANIRSGSGDRKEDNARVGRVPVGVTSADYGIAASGSVVLCHGPGRPRAASLLVESHIVLLPADRIVASLGDAMEQVSWAHTSNISVITGPSRTGDIESVLTLGVHGPRHVHILVIE